MHRRGDVKCFEEYILGTNSFRYYYRICIRSFIAVLRVKIALTGNIFMRIFAKIFFEYENFLQLAEAIH